MSKQVDGFYRDIEDVVHRVRGSVINWGIHEAEGDDVRVSWQVFALCGHERHRSHEPTTQQIKVTCVTCLARE